MGCLMSKESTPTSDRMHPLLREQHPNSSDPVSSSEQSSTMINIDGIEGRAHVDSIRGPPIDITMKYDGAHSPVVTRASLKDYMRAEQFRQPADVPEYIWFRIHMKDLIEHLRIFNSVIRPNCNRKQCASMTGAPEVEYKWTYDKEGNDDLTISKSMSAATFIEKAIDTSSHLLRTHFKKTLVEMNPESFKAAKTIVRLILRVYCHILYHHHDSFVGNYALPHLNNCFTWFILFAFEAQLLKEEDCLPLEVLISDVLRASTYGGGENNDGGLQLSLSQEDRISTFFDSFSDDVSKLTASSYGTNYSLYSTA